MNLLLSLLAFDERSGKIFYTSPGGRQFYFSELSYGEFILLDCYLEEDILCKYTGIDQVILDKLPESAGNTKLFRFLLWIRENEKFCLKTLTEDDKVSTGWRPEPVEGYMAAAE